MGVSFPCRGINWNIDPPPGVDNANDRVHFVLNFIEVQISKLDAKMPDLERIDEKLRARAMNGQPATDDKVANRLRREITASERCCVGTGPKPRRWSCSKGSVLAMHLSL